MAGNSRVICVVRERDGGEKGWGGEGGGKRENLSLKVILVLKRNIFSHLN